MVADKDVRARLKQDPLDAALVFRSGIGDESLLRNAVPRDEPGMLTSGWAELFGSPDNLETSPVVNTPGHKSGEQERFWKRANFCFRKRCRS
jgi:hypothetical protein